MKVNVLLIVEVARFHLHCSCNVVDTNKCYKLVVGNEMTGVTWDEALAICQQGVPGGINPGIASIHSELENGE